VIKDMYGLEDKKIPEIMEFHMKDGEVFEGHVFDRLLDVLVVHCKGTETRMVDMNDILFTKRAKVG